MKNIVWFLLYIYLIQVTRAVLLEDLSVPSLVLIDDDEPDDVVLDCVYRVENDDEGPLVVKWYKDNMAAYQWIRGRKPDVFPSFRGQIDDSYQVSEDPNYKYRALALDNVSIADTGLYKCVVQTIGATSFMEKHLHVVDIRNHTLNLYHHRMNNETHLECTVENVYPFPTIYITNEDDGIIPLRTTKVNEDESGLFSATSVATVDMDDEDDDETYKCIVSFGDLPWNMTISTSDAMASETHRVYARTLVWLLMLPLLLL